MNFSNLKKPVIILVFVLALAAMFGGRLLGDYMFNKKPVEELLASNDSLVSYAITENQDGYLIEVTPKEVPSLKDVITALESDLNEALGKENYKLEIADKRTRELNEAYYEIHYSIYQAKDTGNYQEMYEHIKTTLADRGITNFRVEVTPRFIYVQLVNGGGYLYERIPNNDTVVQGGSAA